MSSEVAIARELLDNMLSPRPLTITGIALMLAVCLESDTSLAAEVACFDSISGADASFSGPSEFDESFDESGDGGTYSCDLGVNVELVEDTLGLFRRAILFDDRASAERAIRFPLPVSYPSQTEAGRHRSVLESYEEWVEFKNSMLTDMHLSLIMCSSIRSLRVHRGRGAAVGNGLVWLNGERVEFKVGSINIVPIDEADVMRACRSSFSRIDDEV